MMRAIRILVRPPGPMSRARARRLVGGALAGTRWGAGSEFRTRTVGAPDTSVAANDLLIEVASRDRVGSPAYVSHAHDLVQRLYDTEAFLRVEADIPVPAFDPDNVSGGGPHTGARAPFRSSGEVDCVTIPASEAHDWALNEMRVPQALALLPPSAAGGKGIRIGHPDSGYTDHFALGLGQLDLANDRDVISDDDDAVDPLRSPKQSLFRPLPNSGHGTSTASTIVGLGDSAGFHGVATGATLVPIRTTESVVQVFDFDVAKAVRWARSHGCHVVSMSLGGKGLFGLEDAIQEAVDDGMIVMAAAGNQVGFVTAPASYPNCLAIAGTLPGALVWPGSSHGAQVDVSAPGACVWCALFDWSTKPPGGIVRRSHGTSYSVAHVAGIAALWLARHGHANLCATFGRPNVQNLFLTLLRRPGVCRVPAGWDTSQYGAGVIDAEALLLAPLPPPQAVIVPWGTMRSVRNDPLERIALHVDATREDVAGWVDKLLGPGSSTDLDVLRRFEGEIVYLLSSSEGRAALGVPGATIAGQPAHAAAPSPSPDVLLRHASPQLRARIRTQRDR